MAVNPDKPTIALCYDFDGTLAPGNMQERNFIPELNIATPAFWDEVTRRSQEYNADPILTYLMLMVEKARESRTVRFTRHAFSDYGQQLNFFPGVEGWFPRITEYGAQLGVSVEHYVISSGLREMIDGSPIKAVFTQIYASSFMYDQNDVPFWPAVAVNYTTKTQFLFRINKGQHQVWDDSQINDYQPPEQRPVPFERMIFIGDGATDVPCMRLVKEQGGYSVAVYDARSGDAAARKLLTDGRVHFIACADYQPGATLDRQIKKVITRMAAAAAVEQGEQIFPSRPPPGQTGQ